MLTAHDQKTLDNLKTAQFVITKIDGNGGNILIQYAHLHGWAKLGEFGISYGPCGDLRDWTMTGPNGEDCTGAMAWAVEKTQDLLIAQGRKIIAEFEAKAALPHVVG